MGFMMDEVILRFKNQTLWDEYVTVNTDPYGKYIITTAEKWMQAMQPRLDAGEEIKDIAYPCFTEADIDGCTGFQYGCIIKTIYNVWEYGDVLRMWHNLEAQLRAEGERANESGGVLNPALISMTVNTSDGMGGCNG